MEGDSERTDTGNLALNMLQPGAALLAQDCGSGSAPESPIFHMPGLPQVSQSSCFTFCRLRITLDSLARNPNRFYMIITT